MRMNSLSSIHGHGFRKTSKSIYTVITPPSTLFTSNTLTVAGQTPSFLNGLYTMSCSSSATIPGNSNFEPYLAFNGSGGGWKSFPDTFSTTGTYAGNKSTIVSGITVNGEWLQLQVPIFKQMSSYNIYPELTYGTSVLKWKVVGSNDGTTWSLIDSQDFTSNPTYWNGKTLGTTFTVSSTIYAYYRLICERVTPGSNSVYVSIPRFSISVLTTDPAIIVINESFNSKSTPNQSVINYPDAWMILPEWTYSGFYYTLGFGNNNNGWSFATQPYGNFCIVQMGVNAVNTSCTMSKSITFSVAKSYTLSFSASPRGNTIYGPNYIVNNQITASITGISGYVTTNLQPALFNLTVWSDYTFTFNVSVV